MSTSREIEYRFRHDELRLLHDDRGAAPQSPATSAPVKTIQAIPCVDLRLSGVLMRRLPGIRMLHFDGLVTQSRTPSPLDIYCIAIGGTGMAPLACLLQDEGHRVRGVDGKLYPPMSTLLEGAGIVPLEGFEASHLSPAPDLVVVGNAVPRTNPEAQEVERLGLERISMPQALARFFSLRAAALGGGGNSREDDHHRHGGLGFQRLRNGSAISWGVPRNLERSFHRGHGAPSSSKATNTTPPTSIAARSSSTISPRPSPHQRGARSRRLVPDA